MKPPFEITEEILCLTSKISEQIGALTAFSEISNSGKAPILRKANRIRTIQGSLAIEQNTLTIEQVTAVLNGKTILAPPKDIAGVKNAIEIYDYLDKLNPCSSADLLCAHGIMMKGLINDAGAYRTGSVGVVNKNNEIIHFGTIPRYVPDAVENLLEWLKTSKIHSLIKGCVFHYEFELIHPFSDGNGRMGRLWHTLILSKWNPIFAYLPVESIIYKNQAEYYEAINLCNTRCSSTAFIEFMLNIILETLNEATTQTEQVKEQVKEQVAPDKLIEYCKEPKSRAQMQEFCQIAGRKKFYTDYLKPLLEAGLLEMTLPDKPNSRNQKYVKKGCK